jgi:hypothetical protein
MRKSVYSHFEVMLSSLTNFVGTVACLEERTLARNNFEQVRQIAAQFETLKKNCLSNSQLNVKLEKRMICRILSCIEFILRRFG